MEELQELDEHEELEYFGEAEEAEEASPLLAPSHRDEVALSSMPEKKGKVRNAHLVEPPLPEGIQGYTPGEGYGSNAIPFAGVSPKTSKRRNESNRMKAIEMLKQAKEVADRKKEADVVDGATSFGGWGFRLLDLSAVTSKLTEAEKAVVCTEMEKGLPLCMSRCGCHDEEAKNIGSIVELEVDDDQLNLPPPAMPAPASPAFRAPPAEVRGPTASELAGSATPTGLIEMGNCINSKVSLETKVDPSLTLLYQMWALVSERNSVLTGSMSKTGFNDCFLGLLRVDASLDGPSPRDLTDFFNAMLPEKSFKPYHSKTVPRSANLEAASQAPHAPVTTLMLRNIPNKFTQNSLMQEISERGFQGTYDFFYLPMDVHNRSNVAYAFLNFLSPEEAERFRSEFHGRQFQRFRSRKVAAVSNAHLQGLQANLQHFEHRVVMLSRNDQYRPIVFRNGRRVKFEDALQEARELGSSVEGTRCADNVRSGQAQQHRPLRHP
ncbi:ML2 [Symbiodinium pilosum]|uniref:ML2 protein n=1 Tax=Symbiodinium pilosum TaxID=2952 RepID=A0A812KXW0_SYMPI|nr:ML2 [Symbiodinium pilosum]